MIYGTSITRLSLFVLLQAALATAAGEQTRDDTFNCHISVSDTLTYDLTPLAGEHTVSRTRTTPPTTMVDSVTFNICADLKMQDVLEGDQCPSGTRVCMTKTNTKGDVPRIISVVPIAQTVSLDAKYSPISSPKGLNLLLHGGNYPEASSPAQSLNLTLLCSTETSKPTFTSYNGSQLQIEWSAPAGCGSTGSGDAPSTPGGGTDGGEHHEDDEHEVDDEHVGSGIGWFFLVILFAFAAYLGLGAYYNYSTYGATGADLIPHRDFWQEVPYMLKDVISHLCSSVRRRRNPERGGYMSV